ncbi:MAG: protein-disulfide reductase DsbD [Wenzhouxiangellaceae bacterium]
MAEQPAPLWRGPAIALTLIAALFAVVGSAQINPEDLLPPDRAFASEARLDADGDELVVDWHIADGYYLYRHALRFEPVTPGLTLGTPKLPDGARHTDEFFGEVETYRERLTATVPIETLPADARTVEIRLGYQGCADLGLCYPPQRVELSLPRPVTVAATEPLTAPSGGLLDRLGLESGNRPLTGRDEPLPPEQAFRVEAIALDPFRLLVRMTPAAGYYLYRDSIAFAAPDSRIRAGAAEFPEAERTHDEYFGDTEIYRGEVEIPLELQRPAGPEQHLTLQVNFQGCQDDGICYPPMSRSIEVALPAAERDRLPAAAAVQRESGVQAAPTPAAAPEAEHGRLARFIADKPLPLTLGLFVLLGIGLAFTPCVFPMIPILSGILAGEGEDITRGRAFGLSLAYVLAMAVTYTLAGVLAAVAGYNLQAFFQNPWVLSLFAAVFVALALSMFGFFHLQMPAAWSARLHEWSHRHAGSHFVGAAVMGFFSALIVGPCVTAPLIGILLFIAQTGDAVLGGSVLFALAIGMGLPLLAIGVGLGTVLPRAGSWMQSVNAAFGVALLALAIWMLERVLPGGVTMLLWAALLIGTGVFLGALTRLDADSGWPRKLGTAIGVFAVALGLIQLIGAAAGGDDWMRPLKPFVAGPADSGNAPASAQFRRIDTLDELQQVIDDSPQPVLVDFYADWCIDCKRMERSTFADPAVSRALAGFTLVKVDLTDFDAEHRRILEHFDLIGPPAYLFFSNGRELTGLRLYGYMAPGEFTDWLSRVAR